jgi:hypothetical protein
MARWQPQGNNDAVQIQPRYRRIFTVGALLDETIALFRQHWVTLALFGTVALVPSWLLLAFLYLGGFNESVATSSTNVPVVPIVILMTLAILSGLFTLLWTAASTTAADAFMHGLQPTVTGVYGHAVKRFPTLLGALILYVLALLGLSIAATVLFVVTGFGLLGTLAATIGLLFWWLKPTSRSRRLKWIIILTAPFGLVTYYTVRWALLLPAVLIEGRGPLDSIKRSTRLVEHQWFRTFGVLSLASIIVAVLVSVPILLVDAVFALAVPAARLNGELLQVVNSAASSICQVLFSSISTIAYVLLFVDLRNRREGADLGERIESLESAATA